MEKRLTLDALLRAIVTNVYFQPPASIRLTYPCIVYTLDNEWVAYADDSLYQHKKRYLVTVIDRNPDSELPDRVRKLDYCSFSRCYTSDNLNHFVFNIYI